MRFHGVAATIAIEGKESVVVRPNVVPRIAVRSDAVIDHGYIDEDIQRASYKRLHDRRSATCGLHANVNLYE